jgi:hypothetical protein
MRWRLAAALGLGLGLAHACGDEGFSCTDDAQCMLAGEPGRCVEGGHCAYPNAQCPTGLAYPQGAPAGLAGECVPSEALDTGTGGEPTTITESGSSEGTTGPDTGADLEGSSSDTPPLCADPHEPNDDVMQASAIPFGAAQDCNTSWGSALEGSSDADWFVLDTRDGACPTSTELTFVTDPPLQLCALPWCADVAQAEIVSCDGELLRLPSGSACCGVGELRVFSLCGDASFGMMLGIAAADDTPACLPYQAGVFL